MVSISWPLRPCRYHDASSCDGSTRRTHAFIIGLDWVPRSLQSNERRLKCFPGLGRDRGSEQARHESILRADEEAARRVEATVVDDAVAEAAPVPMSKEMASEIVPNKVSRTVSVAHAMGGCGC